MAEVTSPGSDVLPTAPTSHLSPLKILVVAVPYSENLGDQLIAKGLQVLIGNVAPGSMVTFLDLSGRAHPGAVSSYRSNAVTTLFYRLPKGMRPLAVTLATALPLLRRSLGSWTSKAQAADVILIGGGQLIQDVSLNFPVKLSAFAAAARRASRGVALFSVGVDGRMSPVGRWLFRHAFRSPHLVASACRDGDSRTALADLLNCPVEDILLAPDPALHLPTLIPPSAPVPSLVGLNIASPSELASSADTSHEFTDDRMTPMWQGVIRKLTSAGVRVQLFTNGSRIDQSYAEALLQTANNPLVSLQERPSTPEELVDCITRCDIVVAHRLHACIVAVAYSRSIVPLLWDRKVASFFADLGRSDLCVPGFDQEPQRIVDRILARPTPVQPSKVVAHRALAAVALGNILSRATPVRSTAVTHQ